MNRDTELERLVRFYQTLTLETVQDLATMYAPDAHFKDPFNDVRGLVDIARIFEHMFAQLDAPRFEIRTCIVRGSEAFLIWDFCFAMKRGPQCIRGATHLSFGPDGLVVLHRDYWDAAEELYEKLPVLGGFMRLLKRAVIG